MILSRTILCVLLASVPVAAVARNMGQYNPSPEIKAWVENLTDHHGVGCCATADGYPTEAVWDTDRHGYRVKIHDRWYPVPESAVLTVPNRLGHAVVWYWSDSDGGVYIRCFLPGAGV